MNISKVNRSESNQQSFGMKLDFKSAKAKDVFMDWIPFDDFKKALPEIEAMKDKNGGEIVAKVNYNSAVNDLGFQVGNDVEYLSENDIKKNLNNPIMALKVQLTKLVLAVNDRLTKKEYKQLLSPNPAKSPKA